jgi:mRNA interferase MazF
MVNEFFDSISSVTVARLTSEIHDAPLLRVTIQPGAGSGLRNISQVMIDKSTTVPRSKIGRRIGSADASTLRVVNRAIKRFLDLV